MTQRITEKQAEEVVEILSGMMGTATGIVASKMGMSLNDSLMLGISLLEELHEEVVLNSMKVFNALGIEEVITE